MFSFLFLSLLLTVGAENGSLTADPTTSGPASVKPLECGVSAQPISDDPNNHGRVTHGQFPWKAAIYKYDEEREKWWYKCSGTLISSHIVLTVANCFDLPDGGKIKPENIKVTLGKHYKLFDRNESHSVVADVREVVAHNRFTGNISNYAFDVALLDLAVPVKTTPYINPACLLWETTTNINLDGKGYMAGWIRPQDRPKSLQASFSSQTACVELLPKTFEYQRYLVQDKMCAERISGEDFVRGMQGAALTAYVQGAHYVVGVLSIVLGTLNNTICLVTDLRNEGHVNWLRSEKSRLDKLH